MTKVLIVVPHLTSSLRLLANFLRYLDKSYQFTIMVLSDELRFASEFPPEARMIVLKNGTRYINVPFTIWKIYSEARQHDLVVSWAELTPTYLSALGTFPARRPIIGWIHTNLSQVFDRKLRPARLHKPVMRLIYPNLVATVGCSLEVTADLVEVHKIPNAMAIVNAIDINQVRELSNEPIPENLRPLFDEPVVINVAALHFQKNPDNLLRAHKMLLERGVHHRLLWVGNGPMTDEIKSMVKELGIEKTVTLAGFINNPWPLMKAATTFCLSSRFEGYALVLAEALALGLPAVSTNCHSGPAEILDGGKYGILVPPEDSAALADGLQKMLQDDAMRMGFKARALRDMSRQDIRVRVREVEELFQRALRTGRSPAMAAQSTPGGL
jgi:glycosyltransferase involved in cell wall biosynthesis